MWHFHILTNLALIKSTLLHPINQPFNFEEGDNREVNPVLWDNVAYIGVYKDNEYMGLIALIQEKEYQEKTAEVHLALLPSIYGQTVEMGREILIWIRNATQTRRLICPVIDDNRLVRKLIISLGFIKYKEIANGWKKDGVNHMLECYTIQL